MLYRATRQFVDRKGKAHKQGDRFEGSQKEIDEQLATGNIEEVPMPQPPGSVSGEGGEAAV